MSLEEIQKNPEKLESVEQAAMRLVVQALRDYYQTAKHIFISEPDAVADVGEDIAREAIDSLGMSRIPNRLFGKVDFKRAGYIFLPERTVEVALLVDSKAEKEDENTVTIQTSQTSMAIRQIRAGRPVEETGKLPCVMMTDDGRSLLSVTIFVKYNYGEESPFPAEPPYRDLKSIVVLCLPNGLLQEKYNPSPEENPFWRAGRNSPQRGEDFRVRINLKGLQEKAEWRVFRLGGAPSEPEIS